MECMFSVCWVLCPSKLIAYGSQNIIGSTHFVNRALGIARGGVCHIDMAERAYVIWLV